MDSRRAASDRDKAQSLGLKLNIVCVLALLMTVPSLPIEGPVAECTQRAAEVVKD